MANKITLTALLGGAFSRRSLNNNFSTLLDAINEKVLWRDNPAGEDNSMSNDLDMNSNRIINLPSATTPTEPATFAQLTNLGTLEQFTGTLFQTFTAAEQQVAYTLTVGTYTPGANNLAVYIDGVRQEPSAYAEQTSTLFQLSEGLRAGQSVLAVINESQSRGTIDILEQIIIRSTSPELIFVDTDSTVGTQGSVIIRDGNLILHKTRVAEDIDVSTDYRATIGLNGVTTHEWLIEDTLVLKIVSGGITVGNIATDTIVELTTDAGVTIEGILLKDGSIVATAISYDNTASGLTATDVQAAIDEVAAAGGSTFSGALVAPVGTQSIPSSVFTAIAFDDEVYDTDGYHDNVTNNTRHTAPSDGVYKAVGSVTFAANTGQLAFRVTKNGSTVVGLPRTDRNDAIFGYATNVASAPIELLTGDYLELEVFDNTGATTTQVDNGTWFSIEKVG